MISNTTVVELSEVKTRDDRLRITTKADIGSLAESIGQIGMINSPVLRQSGSGYRVVSGFRRIEACQLLQIKTIPAHLVDGSATDLVCVELAITDNAAQRDLNDLELSRCFMLLSPFYPAVASLVSAGRRLGLRAGAGYVRKLLCLASLPEEVQKAVGDGSISLSMSEALLKSNPRDTAALAALFILLRPSLNKQREIFLLCKEISKREGIGIYALLMSPDIQTIVADRELDGNHKTARLRDMLKKRRMPVLSEALEEFDQQRSKLKLGKGARLIPPVGFEGRNYRLTFDFSTRNDLEGHLSTMKQLLRNPAMEHILRRIKVTHS